MYLSSIVIDVFGSHPSRSRNPPGTVHRDDYGPGPVSVVRTCVCEKKCVLPIYIVQLTFIMNSSLHHHSSFLPCLLASLLAVDNVVDNVVGRQRESFTLTLACRVWNVYECTRPCVLTSSLEL